MSKALYIHIPFCDSICAYCDFFRGIYKKSLASQYIDRLILDIEKIQDPIETIYIGGGTPTCLEIDLLEKLFQCIEKKQFHLKEYTIEANIESISVEKIQLMKKYQINRISIGVQSFHNDLLKFCHRNHCCDDIKKTIQLVQDHGVHNISIDLIYGFENQTLKMWQDDLKQAIQLKIQHISIYSLTIEENSYFGRHHIGKVDDDLDADMYEYAIDYLNHHGYKQYEVSNFCIDGYESKHNQMYWNYEDFIGLGLHASGKEHHQRYENGTNFKQYFEGNDQKEMIDLTYEDEMFEMIMMSLRMKKGLNRKLFKAKFNVDVYDVYHEVIDQEIAKHHLILNEDYLYVSDEAFLCLNDILTNFL